MGNGQAQAFGGQGARQRRIGVAIDQHPIRSYGPQDCIDFNQHASRLNAMRTRTDTQLIARRGDVEFTKKHIGHGVVIVLSGMHQHVVVPLTKHPRNDSRLDKLRPGTNNGYDFHP